MDYGLQMFNAWNITGTNTFQKRKFENLTKIYFAYKRNILEMRI